MSHTHTRSDIAAVIRCLTQRHCKTAAHPLLSKRRLEKTTAASKFAQHTDLLWPLGRSCGWAACGCGQAARTNSEVTTSAAGPPKQTLNRQWLVTVHTQLKRGRTTLTKYSVMSVCLQVTGPCKPNAITGRGSCGPLLPQRQSAGDNRMTTRRNCRFCRLRDHQPQHRERRGGSLTMAALPLTQTLHRQQKRLGRL